MRDKPLLKIALVGALVIGVLGVVFLVWNFTTIKIEKDSGDTSTVPLGIDTISGDSYSSEETGGEKGSSLAVLGLRNLYDHGIDPDDVESIRQYASELAINKYNKTIDDIISISKDNIELLAVEGATGNSYTFRVYMDDSTYAIGKLVYPLGNDTAPRSVSFYTVDDKLIDTHDI